VTVSGADSAWAHLHKQLSSKGPQALGPTQHTPTPTHQRQESLYA
jgi:hypothetical protein